MKMPFKFKKNIKKLHVAALAITATLSFATSANSDTASAVSLQTCYADGLPDRAKCGVITQPLNSNTPEQTIDIHFMVIPAIKPLYPDEAVMAFAGGPGQSAIESAAGFSRILKYARENRDIILVDQRGTGKSNLLQCELDDLATQFVMNDMALGFDLAKQDAIECRDKLNSDLSNYTTVAAAPDFEAVRAALGYKQLHLYGGSYGTRIALEYMRQFPQRVASSVLDGLAPSNQSLLAIGGAIEDSLAALFEQCQADAVCAQTYPNLKQTWLQLLQNLEQQPLEMTVRHPRSHQPIAITLTSNKLYSTVRMALYSHSTRAMVPLAITQVAKGNVDLIAAMMAQGEDIMGIALGMHQAILCGEDWAVLNDSQRAQYGKTFIGAMMIAGADVACPIWDVTPVTADYYQAVSSDIPTLLLSGGLDPATPARWAETAMVELSNATHLVAPFATHIVAGQSCGDKLVASFYDNKSTADFDTSCLQEDRRKQFFMNINGPASSQDKE